MTPDLIPLLLQVPIVGIFAWFMLRWQVTQRESTHANHEEWRAWLSEREERMKQMQEEWRAWLSERDSHAKEERDQIIVSLARLDRQIELLTNITLLIYSAVRGNEAANAEVEKWIEEGRQK